MSRWNSFFVSLHKRIWILLAVFIAVISTTGILMAILGFALFDFCVFACLCLILGLINIFESISDFKSASRQETFMSWRKDSKIKSAFLNCVLGIVFIIAGIMPLSSGSFAAISLFRVIVIIWGICINPLISIVTICYILAIYRKREERQ